MKIAAYEFCKNWEKADWRNLDLRLLVHDEMSLSVAEADCEAAQKLLGDTMVRVAEHMHEGIRGVAEVYSGNSWSAKH